MLSIVSSGSLGRQPETTSPINVWMELEVDPVQIIFREVYMDAITLEASDTLRPFKEPCKKKSKKIRCKARLIATCYFSNPEEVVITVDGNHCHVFGSAEDL